jgi:hypothetical protein
VLLLPPLIKTAVLPQPEAIEEGTTNQGEGLLDVSDQGGALFLRGGHRELLGLFEGQLHHVEVPFQRSLRVQTEQLLFSKQMGRRVGVVEQAAQQGQGVAQGGSCLMGSTIRPQQGSELAPWVHAPFDRQIEQQGLRLAQGKAEAVAVVKDFWWAEHGQT